MPLLRRPATPLEKRLGYRFKRLELLDLALTHRSWAYEEGLPEHYERLEFLGDAVLGMVAADWLYQRHPELPEGELSKRKAHLVSKTVLAPWAERLELGSAVKVGVGEERSGGRGKPSILADSLEAVFGAIYLDGGLGPAREVILLMLEEISGERVHPLADAKTRLQEYAQARGWPLPDYRLAAAAGPDHNKLFTVECWVAGELAGQGEGPSKKIAEQRAAAEALGRLVDPPGI